MVFNAIPTQLKILIIDDDRDTCDLLRGILEKENHQVLTTTQPQSALRLLQHEAVDLIILDIMMPDLDGLTLLEALRRETQAPILMLTALSDPRVMQQCYDMGASDYLVKPFAMTQLKERVRRLAEKIPPRPIPDTTWQAQFRLDVEQNLLVYKDLPILLTPTESRLLRYLLDNAFHEVTWEALYHAGWGNEILPEPTARALVENTIRSLLYKMQPDSDETRLIQSTMGGYIFLPE
ncbi:response regulator transcription factor [Thermanaerothrix daxensis]|uniref:response regulator transcription factor n=1 Tax=Thermanaerothrix daxensis TaxID=869279 RepID=UPI0006C8ED4D|nr:response regulator transcription factor [Thermanaerothrix daxensis]